MATLTVKELFDFAVDPAINDDNIDDALDALMEVASKWVMGAGKQARGRSWVGLAVQFVRPAGSR